MVGKPVCGELYRINHLSTATIMRRIAITKNLSPILFA